ncbi:hypothetical protein SDC9_186699 [bioreactor metagenome]|uniref:Uncharacterized protein n=1 Tax=bioreactor metagenome TaxID=1076179 RepID=A0A645HJH6_9ZZZZ
MDGTGPDTFVSILNFAFFAVYPGRLRTIVAAIGLFDILQGLRLSFLADSGGIRTDIGDQTYRSFFLAQV